MIKPSNYLNKAYLKNLQYAFRSVNHFRFYALGMDSVKGVFEWESERALVRVETQADGKTITKALLYAYEYIVTESVKKYLSIEIDRWLKSYQNAHSREESVRRVSDFVSSPKVDRMEKMFRDEGDDAIRKRKRFEHLQRTLNERGLEAYLEEFELNADLTAILS